MKARWHHGTRLRTSDGTRTTKFSTLRSFKSNLHSFKQLYYLFFSVCAFKINIPYFNHTLRPNRKDRLALSSNRSALFLQITFLYLFKIKSIAFTLMKPYINCIYFTESSLITYKPKLIFLKVRTIRVNRSQS